MAKYGASFATASAADVTLRFPPAVSARQRAILHAVAEANGVAHASAGDGEERYVSLGSGARVIEFLPEDVADDEALCALLAEHLRVAPEASRRAFAAPAPRGATRDLASRRFGDSDASSSATGSSPPPASRASVDVAAFVQRTLELLDLEREAEAEQGEAILRGMRPETAQRRGRALLGLKCVDVRGGFFGKTVVTLELASRGAGATEKSANGDKKPHSNSTAPPLPPHKLTPHDVVALRANKGDAGGDPLCAGVVYRVRDAQLEIALDETPDDGTLDGTLRLERLANETSHKRLVDAVRDIGRAGETGAGVDLARFPGARLVEVLFGSTKPRFATVRAVFGADGAPAPAREDESDVADSSIATRTSLDDARSATVVDPFEPIDRALDRSQKNAVARALAAEDVALIHGPPGTGKTTAVVEYVLQERLRGRRVLCCAASNVAVDTLVERLLRSDFADADSESGASSGPERGGGRRREKSSSRTEKSKTKTREKNPRGARRVTETLIRLGHPARLLPSVLGASLEAAVARSDDSALARDCERECADLRRRLAKLTSREHRAERADARRELRRVQKETKARQKKAVSVVVSHANIVCCTLSGALTNAIRNETFDVVVIDEAAQALEPACWGAMFKARKTVLAGDHLQLPPTVVSDAAAKGGLATTLFARAHHRWPEAAVMLTTQYRMHASIAQWASDELYQGRLVAAPSAAERRLTLGGARGDCTAKRSDCACCAEGTRDCSPHLQNVYPGDGDTISSSESADVRLPALVLVDTAGCGMDEQREEEGDSTGNPSEARVAFAVARRLVFSGSVLPEELGIIAPYSAQVGLLRELRAASEDTRMARVEIATVDGFQGREKDCVVLSATRSNEKGDVGFLADARRMNVAVTRARMHCVLVCDTDTVGRHDAFLRRLVAHFEARGEYVAASEFDEE